MKTIASPYESSDALTERRLMISSPRTVLLTLLAWTVLMMPAVVIAKDKDPDHDRDDRRHGLLDRINTKADIAALQAQVTDLKNQVASLTSTETTLVTQLKSAQSTINALQTALNTLTSTVANGTGGSSNSVLNTLAKYVTIEPNPINGLNGPHVIFTGVNVHIRSGSGATGDGGTPLGLGNLVVGYNAPPVQGGGQRNGSHNLIGGDGNSFSSFGGLVFGSQNSTGGPYTAIVGGESNQATGFASSILGGRMNFVGSGDQTIP